MELVKCDVLSFGILLLRLFCRTSAPEDDKSLVEWVSGQFFVSCSSSIPSFLSDLSIPVTYTGNDRLGL